MKRSMRIIRALLALLPLGAGVPAAAQTPREPQVRAVAAVVAEAAGARVEVRLARTPPAPLVGSFTGEVTFDPRFAVAGAEVPGGLMVDWNAVAPGRVRFAGISTTGLGDVLVLTLHLRGGVASPAPAAVRLTEATATDPRVRLAP